MIDFLVNRRMYYTRCVLGDLSSNAYKHGIKKHSKSSYFLEIYVGKKGLLFGTHQETSFLTNK